MWYNFYEKLLYKIFSNEIEIIKRKSKYNNREYPQLYF